MMFSRRDLLQLEQMWRVRNCLKEFVVELCPEGFNADLEWDFSTGQIFLRMRSDGISGSARRALHDREVDDIVILGFQHFPFRDEVIKARDALMLGAMPGA